MDFKATVEAIIERGGIEAVKKHASVSIMHGCRCGQCFCCYCVDYLKQMDKAE